MKKCVLLLLVLINAQIILAQTNTFINEKEIVSLINSLRTEGCKCGNEEVKPVTEVVWSKKLAEIAQKHSLQLHDYSAQMQTKDFVYLSHVGTDGSTTEQRLQNAGCKTNLVVENIGYVEGKEDAIVDYWINNPESCKNLMNKKVTTIGIGRAENFWTIILTTPIY